MLKGEAEQLRLFGLIFAVDKIIILLRNFNF